MSAMNNLDLKLKEADNLVDQVKEVIQSIRESLSNNPDKVPCDDQSKRDPVEDKVTVREMLAKKSAEGYTAQVKDLLISLGPKSYLT